MIEDLELLLGMEDVDSKTYRRLELIVNATRSRPAEGDGLHHSGGFRYPV